MKSRIPAPLFVLEMANNHMGDVEHGLRLIRECASACGGLPAKVGFKMQYRHLDTLIHPDFRERTDIKYIKRFSQTRLDRANTRRLVQEIKGNGFVAVCTPFDETSVDLIEEDGFEILKIASCSFNDWPLLERIAATKLPVIASTAGVALRDIDNVVAFLRNRGHELVLLHCVAEYPTPSQRLQMNQIDFLRNRYPDIPIGFSTHEDPAASMPVAIAIAKGCQIFEKHVGLATEQYAINSYSATPPQVGQWLRTALEAFSICGVAGKRMEPTKAEADALFALRRGIYARRDIAAGERIHDEDIVKAIPTQEGHVTANDWSKYNHFFAVEPIKAKAAITTCNSRKENVRDQVYGIVQRVRGLLREGRVVVPGEAALEISHHYGLEKFDEFGITMITVVNREYCKKLIAVLPGQKHPNQYHKHKEETFHVLHGTLRVTLDGQTREHGPGSVIVVERGVHHAFESSSGSVMEEISTNHHVNDSYYTDPLIAANKDRKTFLRYWMD